MSRSQNITNLENTVFDALVIGSGINGAISAARLSNAGYKIALIDKNDFASSTSQESSSLVWGGIKYMENYEFGLVRHLCLSRNEMMKSYPSQIKEIRFLATHSKKDTHWLRTYWLGTWFYWLLGSGFTKKPKIYSTNEVNKIEDCVITDYADGAIEYSDSYLPENDSRFVYRFAYNAKENGAVIFNYCKAEQSNFENQIWTTKCLDQISQKQIIIKSKTIINCGGPYADEVNQQNNVETQHKHILSKGVHLIVPRIQKTDCVLTFLSDDKRPFFVIPMKFCSCIGTTDTPTQNPLEGVTEKDRQFILDNINKRIKFNKPLTKDDIIGERCGVRPLVQKKGQATKGDWVSISRKHEVEVNSEKKSVTIFGGKLTDCLNVAEEIFEIINKWHTAPKQNTKKWYGDPTNTTKEKLIQDCTSLVGEAEAKRLYSRYSTRLNLLPDIIQKYPQAKEKIFNQAEYYFYDFILMHQTEDIVKPEDILRRRTELSLTIKKSELKASAALKEAFKIMFSEKFDQLWHEYFSERSKQLC